MADIVESSSMPSRNHKPVIVRVKRKAFQSRVEAFWLEIKERSLNQPLLDFENLSISDSPGEKGLETEKLFMQHMETISSSKVTMDTLQSLVVPNSTDAFACRAKVEVQRPSFKKEKVFSKRACFEQIWWNRMGIVHEEELREMYHFYDVVRVDIEETTNKVQHNEMMPSYSPLLREFIPSSAEEIDSDIRAYMSKQASAEDYVYDLYAVKDDIDTDDLDASIPFPLVQVNGDDSFYDGPDESEFETDYSNDNPLNDYPDEETSEDEEVEVESRTSSEESELRRCRFFFM